jgi:hypothetical protein
VDAHSVLSYGQAREYWMKLISPPGASLSLKPRIEERDFLYSHRQQAWNIGRIKLNTGKDHRYSFDPWGPLECLKQAVDIVTSVTREAITKKQRHLRAAGAKSSFYWVHME